MVKKKTTGRNLLLSFLGGVLAAVGLEWYVNKEYDINQFNLFEDNKREIPLVTEVQDGYVAPALIEEIINENLDTTDELPETYAVIAGERYALIWTPEGLPYLAQYSTQIVPKVPHPATKPDSGSVSQDSTVQGASKEEPTIADTATVDTTTKTADPDSSK